MAVRAGFIGLGNIGKPMAGCLAPAGFDTWVYDLDPDPVRELCASGAKAASSPREVAENADVIGICVPEDKHVRAVLKGDEGVLAGAAPGTLVAIHSTVQPATVIELADAAAGAGVTILDAAVTGGADRAERGVLTYLVGGAEDDVEKLSPFLAPSSESVIHAGPLGSGAKLKLCINVVTYIQWAAAYEGIKLAMASGLDPEVFEAAGRANGQLTELQQRYLLSVKMPPAIRDSEPFQNTVRGHMNIAEKDLAWALQLGRESGLAMPVSGLVSQMMARLYSVNDDARR